MTSSNRMASRKELRPLPDDVLCREVASGNQEAFLELFDRYWEQVYRLANAVIRDQAEAEDLAQTLFLEVHVSMLRFDSQRGSFRHLLLRYAYTRAIDQRRRLESRQFYSHIPLEGLHASCAESDSSLSVGLSVEERSQLIEEALQQLDEKQRTTVEAYFFRGLSLNEVANEMDDSFGNVRHYLYRGLAKMRRFIAPETKKKESEESSGNTISRFEHRIRKRVASEVSVVRTRTI